MKFEIRAWETHRGNWRGEAFIKDGLGLSPQSGVMWRGEARGKTKRDVEQQLEKQCRARARAAVASYEVDL